MKVRVRDIAARANVSPATVSNALNGKPGVGREVTERILAIASEMGYTLKQKPEQHNHIRLIVFKVHGQVVMDTQFFGELIESIQRECQKAKLELIVSHVNAAVDKHWREQVCEFCAEECGGIILLGTEMGSEELALFSSCASPLVVLDNLCRHEPFHAVVMNNYMAGFKATEALYRAGHRKIAHLTSSIPFSNMRYRRKGYEAAMADFGLTGAADCWALRPTIEGAYTDMKRLLETGRSLPTAFFAGNDIMAIGALRAMGEAGLSVPDDISIIGMDDTDLCLACNPPLSTIRVYRKELGIAAMRTLVSVIPDLKSSTVKTELDVELVQRNTVRILSGQQ